jgi:uncharacterized coiled-coil DUF342 family protein
MARAKPTPLQRQLSKATRRLFFRTMLTCVFWGWFVAFLLSAGWFLTQPYLAETLPGGVRLLVGGSLIGAATLIGLIVALFRAPAKLAAALLLDERFGLKERVTTSLTLSPELKGTPAAQALLADVNQRIAQVDVGSRFPLRVSWITSLAPACAALLALAAFYYRPPSSQATLRANEVKAQAPENAAEIEQKLNQLKKRPAEKRQVERAMSEELKRIEAELDQIANRPRANKEQLKERIKEMTALEDRLKNREREMAERSRSMKQQLQQMERMAGKSGNEDGPAKDLQKALSQGNMEQAKEEMEKLSKKLKENRLTAQEKEQLAKQLKKLQEELERAAGQKDKIDQLKKLHQEGKLDAEALKREIQRLQQDSAKLQDLQKLAAQLGQVRKNLQQGNGDAASAGMSAAADAAKSMELGDDDLRDLRDQLQRLQDAKDSC